MEAGKDFDIHHLDEPEWDDEENQEAFEDYAETLVEKFWHSPEGEARRRIDPGLGFWAGQMLEYGYNYVGVSVPEMSVNDAREIVEDVFPRKISTQSPEDADDTIPELIAFWEFLKREYELANADPILDYLREVEPRFKELMNDPSNFGMAKSFFMSGQAAGFDMARQEEMDEYMALYNASLLAAQSFDPPEDRSFFDTYSLPSRQPSTPKNDAKKKKRRRKMARKSRRRNRKKR